MVTTMVLLIVATWCCARRRPRRWWRGSLLILVACFLLQARASLTEGSDPNSVGASSLRTGGADPSTSWAASSASSRLLPATSSSLAAPARRLDESHRSAHREHSGHVHHHQHHQQDHNSQPEGVTKHVGSADSPTRPSAMFLDGFHWSSITSGSSASSDEDSRSFLGLWDSWSRLQLLGSMGVAFLLSLALEGVTLQRRRRRLPAPPHAAGRQRPTRRYILLLHATASLLGYLTMLVAMSYSGELFVALLLGHAAGQHWWGLDGGTVAKATGGKTDHKKDKAPPLHKGLVFEFLSRLRRGSAATSTTTPTTWRGLFALPAARERARRLATSSQSSSSHHEKTALVPVDGSSALDRDESESTTNRDCDDDDLLPVRRKRDRTS